MKKLILIPLILLMAKASTIVAQEINWLTIEQAMELQKSEPKKIIMDVYTNWCGPCKMLDKHTFHNPDVVDYINTHYYAVKFNAEGNTTVTYKDMSFGNPNFDPAKVQRRNSPHEFTRFLKVSAYPTMVFFDEQANFIAPISGYMKPRQIELYLKLFKSDKYKEMTSQEQFNAYYKAFQPSFKE